MLFASTRVKNHKHHQVTAKVYDRLMFVIGIASPIVTLPQVFDIYQSQKVEGLSIITWGAYTIFSGFWLVYGFVHKEKPIIASQLLLVPIQSCIVIGILLFR